MIETTPYLVEGIGRSWPPNVHIQYVDEVMNVTDGESFEMSRQRDGRRNLLRWLDGTNMAAALRVARDLHKDAVVVFIICDTGGTT